MSGLPHPAGHGPAWGVGMGTLRRYFRLADDRLAATLDADRGRLIARHTACRRQLYNRCLGAAQYRDALAVLDSEAKLLGLSAVADPEPVPGGGFTRRPFGLDWLAEFLPHHLTARTPAGGPAWSRLHADLAADLAELSSARGGRRAYSAPRGAAKTTVGTVGYALWAAVEGREPLAENPAWTARRYASIARWPDRADLWAAWERAVANLADPDRLATARQFYEANRAAMDAGAVVLWPEREPLYDLMLKRAEIGPAAFDSEKQDRPGTDGATEFPAEYFDWPGLWFDDWPELVVKVQVLDPSKGTVSKAGDYQAHARGGLAKDGTIYIEADLRREPVTDMVGRAIDWASSWGVHELAVEENGTMGLIAPEFDRQLKERKKLVSLVTLTNTDPKLARIRRAGGYLSRRQLRVRNTPGGRLLVDQWRDVPSGEYDDGPDAVGTLLRRLELLVNGGR